MKNYLLCILMIVALFSSAQNPSNDNNWVLNESLSDEFNGTTINQEKWSSTPHWGTCEDKGKKNAYRYDETPQASHFSLSNGVLTLKAIKEKCTCKDMDWDSNKYKYYNAYYSEGALFSKGNRFKYGYFEIRCKFPDAYKFKGINPSFWLYGKTSGDTNSWNEIDIYEFNGYRNIHTCNAYYRDYIMVANNEYPDNDNRWILRSGDNKTYYDFYVDFYKFHTFACEWTPEYINFYYDDKLVRRTESKYCGKLESMIMYVTMGIEDGKFGDSENNVSKNTKWPYSYQIDYIRYYNMKMDCKTVVNKSNFDFNKFNYAVKKSITLKNSSVPQNGKFTLRATDFIELQGEFTVPFGSELTIIPTPEFEHYKN